ncbi:MAG: BatD family protein [Methylovulum sp.]|nr:BatD family protein [Methylovulum sp.]
MKAQKTLLTPLRHPLQCLLWLFLLTLAPYSWAAHIQVTVDRNPVNLNDSFQIVFTATENPDDDPDFSPLEQDFSILHQSHGSSASWVNGQSSKTIQWTVNVMAKTAGNLEIPAIHFGNDTSSPLPIEVIKGNPQTDANNNEELFVKAEASPTQSYIQAQVIYTVRVYTRVEIARAQLSEPELADAVIEKLGEDANYNTEINGVAYSVTERKYAIFPQKSGALSIKPLVLTAEVLTAGPSRYNNFFSAPIAKTRRVESSAITLDVKAAKTTGQHWLPAEQLELKQVWSGDTAQMKVGEPLTRTLTLVAKGTTVGQLPELNAAQAVEDLKAYPDQPVLKEQKNADGLVSLREEKIALMPSKPGSYTLPAISLPWFNTKTQQMALATLPETVLTVAADTEPTPTAVPTPTATIKPEAPSAPVLASVPAPQATANDYWPWLVSGLLAVGWLTTWAYFLWGGRKKEPLVDEAQMARQLKLHDIVSQLKKACSDNNAIAAKNALLDWGRLQFNETNLGAIAKQCEARLRDEIVLLNQVLYSKDAPEWQGKRLFQTFTENQARAKLATQENGALPPLHRL